MSLPAPARTCTPGSSSTARRPRPRGSRSSPSRPTRSASSRAIGRPRPGPLDALSPGASAVKALEHGLLLAGLQPRAAVEHLDPPGPVTIVTADARGE